jgi:hypothetical protein
MEKDDRAFSLACRNIMKPQMRVDFGHAMGNDLLQIVR